MTVSTSAQMLRPSRWLKPMLAVGLLAANAMSFNAVAEPAEPEHKMQRGSIPAQRGGPPPIARPAPVVPNVIGRVGPPPSARPVAPPPPAAVYRPTPPPQIAGRPFPHPGYAPPPPRPSYAPPPPPPPRYHSGRRYNPGVAIGVGAAIIGATLGYRYYRGPNRDNVYDRCDRNFPEFDYDTGTFTNEDGDRELCPYLRPYLD